MGRKAKNRKKSLVNTFVAASHGRRTAAEAAAAEAAGLASDSSLSEDLLDYLHNMNQQV